MSMASAQEEKKRGRFETHAALILICVLMIVPFLWMLSTSLKTLDKTMEFPPRWWPRPIAFSNYWYSTLR